ncbi:HNH endonuclease signature motif containing protein [Amycolatopsis sp. NPDC003731]
MCQVCGVRASTEVDHIIPYAEGGTDDEANARGVCAPCHDEKSKAERARGLARYRASRRGQARKPERHPGLLD